MPKVRASSGTMGTMCLPMFLSFSSTPRMRTKAMVVEISRSPVPSSSDWKAVERRHRQRRRVRLARRQVAAERLAPRLQVAHLLAVLGRLAERHVGDVVIGERDVEAVAQLAQRLLVQLLLLVRDHLALGRLAEAEALDGLAQDHGRPALVCDGRGVGRIDLAAHRGRRGSGARCRRPTCWRPSPSAPDPCRRNARACTRRPWP